MKKTFLIYPVIVTVLVLIITTDCKKDEPAAIPLLTTSPVTNVTATTAMSGGNIKSDGRSTITARGVCWSTTANPTTSDSKTNDGAATGQFESEITGLTAGLTFHVRAYATNAIGTAYGDDMPFSTLGQPPSSVTQPATNVTLAEVTLNGTVNANDLSTTVTFEYGTTTSYGSNASAIQSPVIGNTITSVSSNITGLSAATVYHFRVKAVNSLGTTYGSDETFTIYSGLGEVNDIDGNIYDTVTIGTQVWMAENLKTTKYNDNTTIPLVSNETAWGALTTPGYGWYNSDITNKSTYGALYNWFVVDAPSNGGKNVCPTGWHVPTDAEWITLITYLGGDAVAGGKLKEAGTSHWITPNTGATNESGFTALPGGDNSYGGMFVNAGLYGSWWSSSEYSATGAYFWSVGYNSSDVRRYYDWKQDGLSVRCLRDF